jgi:hypothetical protein
VRSVGVSAMRNQGSGVLAAVHKYLKRVRLEDIPSRSEGDFQGWLNARTIDLMRAMPRKKRCKSRRWGTARKALNLFLRECACNHHLRRAYALSRIERWLEIPLDSVTAKELKKRAERGHLPPWPGLGKLVKRTSDAFQAYAVQYSESDGVRLPARVYLDDYLWPENR